MREIEVKQVEELVNRGLGTESTNKLFAIQAELHCLQLLKRCLFCGFKLK